MLKGLSNAGIGHQGDLESFIGLASTNGFQAVDTSGEELEAWLDAKGAEAVNAYLKQHDVIIGSIGLSPEWRHSEEEFQAGLVRLAKDAAAAAAVGCTRCCTYILPATDYEAARFMAQATRRLRTCAQILGAHGISLGLEFVGPHHLRTAWKNPFVWDIEGTLDFISAIGEANVGLLFDSYHWYTNGNTYEDILKLRTDQIVHVHLNDAKDVPYTEALDNDRVYPGEGVIDLSAFLRGLREIGFRGVVAQEILTREEPEGTPEERAARSGEAYRSVYRAAGLA
ncbi:xylose isomerase [Paenibacillus swuensis]|uniref:Xylose isomerase n=1 Tax=Paenibacillus swuensis TaxID=1178515 RepID=A0A172TDG6_9BACL|nr:sugar phosphate isomerase/epimerase family protein [Paenibacillus swuensis]ANE45060.1 xylose isomerase [Paenibacillus swuensis]